MNSRILSILTIITIFYFSLFSCNAEDEEFKLIVLCDGPFEGTYIYNSNNPVGFGESSEENPYHQTGNSYYFQKIFTDLDSIEVDATRYYCTDALKIKIYRKKEGRNQYCNLYRQSYFKLNKREDYYEIIFTLSQEYINIKLKILG